MQKFHLLRIEDKTGVSGIGKVAEGVEFSNGLCAMVWLTEHTSMVWYMSLAEVKAIHGRHGSTKVVMEE